MAGEFLQLLASMERQKKSEVDADLKLASAMHLQRRREESQSQERSLSRKHQANMYLLNSSLNEQRTLKTQVSKLETGLEDLGMSITQQSSLKPQDQTEEAKSILDLTYENDVRELDFNQLASANVGEKISAISTQNDDLEDRIEVLQQHKREYDAVDNSLKEMSKQFFENEMGQAAQGNMEWVVDEREMAAFMAINEEDYNTTVQQFGGDEAEVQRRLRSHFGKYTKEQMKLLNDVYAVQAERANVIKTQQAIGMLPPPFGATAKAMKGQLDDNVKSFNGLVTQMGITYEAPQIKDEPILAFFAGSTVPDRSGIAGSKQYMGKLEQRMSSVIRELDSYDFAAQDIDSNFRKDKRALSLWYSGQIANMDEWLKDNPEYKSSKADFKDSSGNKYMFVDSEDTQLKYANDRVSSLDFSEGSFSNPENVLFGAISFFREYSKAHEVYDGIEDQKSLLFNSIGVVADPVSGGRNVGMRKDKYGNAIADNENEQMDVDRIMALQIFNDEFNIEFGAIYKNAKEAGYGNDVMGYMDEFRGKAGRPSFNMSEAELKDIYSVSGIEGDGVPATERAVDIIARLEEIEKSKNDVFKEWLHAGGDDQLQWANNDIYGDYGYMGAEWETMHEEGADLIDELTQIRDIAAKLGDSGLWDYYLEGQLTEDKIMGKRKIYTDEAMSIFNPRQLDPSQERGLVGGAIRQAPFIGRLFSPIEEEDIILKGQTGKGYKDRFKHRSQYDRIDELE